MNALDRLLASWRFPVFALSLLFFGTLALAAVLLVPAGDSALASFAEDFKTWCFGYDPATGEMETMYVVVMVAQPAVLGLIIAGLWWAPLRELGLRGIGRAVPWAVGGLLLVAGGAAVAGTIWKPTPDGELPFPAEALRTTHTPPAFTLTDQDGQSVSLADLRGRVVVLTGVYASCVHTCPGILQQVKIAVEGLDPAVRERVTVVAVSLDPENDTQEKRATLAGMHGLSAPTYRLVNGDVGEVNRVLDRLGITRSRDPDTGIIDHANLYAVVDIQGRIAYRFTLGERQARWLAVALDQLAREAGGGPRS